MLENGSWEPPGASGEQTGGEDPLASNPALGKLVSGEVPGTWVPAGFDLGSLPEVSPEQFYGAGLAIYKPHDRKADLVLYNPKSLSQEKLSALDRGGQLTSVLPPLPELTGAPGAATPAGNAEEADASNAPSANPLPILPRPTMGASAQLRVANQRMDALSGQQPSERAIPGGGQILNSLLQKPV